MHTEGCIPCDKLYFTSTLILCSTHTMYNGVRIAIHATSMCTTYVLD